MSKNWTALIYKNPLKLKQISELPTIAIVWYYYYLVFVSTNHSNCFYCNNIHLPRMELYITLFLIWLLHLRGINLWNHIWFLFVFIGGQRVVRIHYLLRHMFSPAIGWAMFCCLQKFQKIFKFILLILYRGGGSPVARLWLVIYVVDSYYHSHIPHLTFIRIWVFVSIRASILNVHFVSK